MVFKIDLNNIIDGMIKEFPESIPQSIDLTLRQEIVNDSNKIINQLENTNLVNLINPIPVRKPKLKIKSNIKKKIILVKDKHIKKPTPNDIVIKIHEKELLPETFNKNKETELKQTEKVTHILSPGKRLTVADGSSFVTNTFLSKLTDSVETNEKFVADPLRGRSGKFWSVDSQKVNLVYQGTQPEILTKIPYNFDYHETFNDTEPSDFGRTYQIVAIEANPKRFLNADKKYSKEMWFSYVVGKPYKGSQEKKEKLDFDYSATVEQNKSFHDYIFDLSTPFSFKELENFNNAVGTLNADIEPNYNFFIEDYETTLNTNPNVLENTLPNMYVMLSVATETKPNPVFKNLISLNNTIVTDEVNLLAFKLKNRQTNVSRVYDLKTNPGGEYFDLFGRQYQKAVDNGSIKNLNEKFSNIVLSVEELPLLTKFNDKKELFPLYVDIKFSTDKTTTFTQMLRDTNLLNSFTTKVVNKIIDKKSDVLNTHQASEETTRDSEVDNLKKVIKLTKKVMRG